MTTRTLALLLAAGVVLAGSLGALGHPAHGASYTLRVVTASVEGHSQTILTDAKGFALYYLTSDTPASSTCTGGCAMAWPPLVSATTRTAPSSLGGRIAVVHTANGAQVSYNGHLLYRYAADTKPGQVNGNDQKGPQGGEWYVATSSLAAAKSQATPKGRGYSVYR
jgi:predicted lipoprotein with Yx(FWY)xxD motif